MPNATASEWRRVASALCVVGVLAACSGSTSVRPFGGTYALVEVNGLPLPQPEYSSSINPQIAGGSLTVAPDTLYVFLSLQPVDAGGHAVGDTVSFKERIPYFRQADSLVLGDVGTYDGGAIVGSSVRLRLVTPASSVGFANENRYLFVP